MVKVLRKRCKIEIVSITVTLSEDRVHIHISISDEYGNAIGDRLKDRCIVNTTAEVVIKAFDDIKFTGEYDKNTGYDELVIK